MKHIAARRMGGLAPMWVAGLVWLCSLPLISWLLVPRVGLGPAGATALGLLVLVGGLCWGLCTRGDAPTGSPPSRFSGGR